MRVLQGSLIFAAGSFFALLIVDPWPTDAVPDIHFYKQIAQVAFFSLLIVTALAEFLKRRSNHD